MDSLFTSVPTDSVGVYTWIGHIFPGMAAPIILLLTSWVMTRAIWILKFLPVIVKIAPGPVGKVFGWLHEKWGKLGWIVNPLLMFLLGMGFTGGNAALSTLITFAGIGVREWLIKSPIPTSKKELMKVKAASILILGMFLLLAPSVSSAQTDVLKPKSRTLIPSWLSVAVGGGFVNDFRDDATYITTCNTHANHECNAAATTELDKSYPFASVRLGYLISSRLKLEVQPSYILQKEKFSSLTFAAYIVF